MARPKVQHPTDDQNDVCVHLEKLGYRLNKTQSERVAKELAVGPVYVFEVWKGQDFRRILLGPRWATVTLVVKGRRPVYASYTTREYAKFACESQPS